MRIFAITHVHNERDVIESLCRYTLLFCDGMIILDSNSTDNTKDIIHKMIAEGLSIYLVEGFETNHAIDTATVNRMVRIAVDNYNADLVLPIDADEFLFCPNGDNPRCVLETLDPGIEFRIPWRTYAFTQPADDNTCFLPSFFRYRRAQELSQYYKVAISRNLIENYDCKVVTGNHSLIYPNRAKTPVSVEHISSLAYAHYPLRGIFQAMSKSIRMEFVLSAMLERNDEGYQYQAILNTISSRGKLSVEDVMRLSMEYAIAAKLERTISEHVQLVEDPLVVSFAKEKLILRYTDYGCDEDNFIRTIFSSLHEIIEKQTEDFRNSEEERKLLSEKNYALERDNDEINEIIVKLEQNLAIANKKVQKIQASRAKILASKSWSITRPIRYLNRIFHTGK